MVVNSRFVIFDVIFDGVRVPNLASTALGLAARQLADDWEQKYPYRPVLIETCVDTARFSGSAYKAAGWERIGSTQHRASKSRKDVYWKPLTTDFKPILRMMPRTPAPKSARQDLRARTDIDEAITRPWQTLIIAAARFRRVMPRTMTPTGRPAVLSQGRTITRLRIRLFVSRPGQSRDRVQPARLCHHRIAARTSVSDLRCPAVPGHAGLGRRDV